jgi:xylulokinase
MRIGSKREEMYRAILEACAYGMREIIESFHGAIIKELRVCGGQTDSKFFLQMYSDVCGLPILIPEVKEAGVLGCAALASVAYGAYKNIREACKNMVRIRERIEPEEEKTEQYAHYYELYKEAYRINAELMHMLG